MDLENLDEAKQKTLIELWNTEKEIKEAKKDKERIGEELKELIFYKEQYQKELIDKQELEKEIKNTQNNLHKLKVQREEVIKDLDKKITIKTKDFNDFKDSKKNLVSKLTNQEKDIKESLEESAKQFLGLSSKYEGIEKREKLVEKQLISLQEREKTANALKSELNYLQEQIKTKTETINKNVNRTEQVKREKEQELKKQKKITNELNNKLNELDLKIEVQDRREIPIQRLEENLKNKEIKLLDDRKSLQRAWNELSNK